MSRPIYGLTIRALLGQRRTLALVLLSLAPVFMALVFSLAADADADPHNFYSRLVQRLFIPVITALVAEQLPQSAAAVVSPATAAIVMIAATVAGALLGARAMTRAELP